MFSTFWHTSLATAVALAALLFPSARAAEPDLAAFNAFGGKPGIDRVAELGVERVIHDPRIQDRFKGANIPRLKMQLSTQFCALLGGPCDYTGADMQKAHAGMGLKDYDFNALAEDFQIAMDEAGVPFRWQNSLLAKLAPMERQISQ